MSVYATMYSTGGALGLVAGGLLTRYADWRWVFFVAVPIGLAAAAGAVRVFPETPWLRRSLLRHRRAARDRRSANRHPAAQEGQGAVVEQKFPSAPPRADGAA